MKEKIIEIVGFNIEPERAELIAQQVLDLFAVSGSLPDYDAAEKFLQEEKDIYNHPYLSNRNKDNTYDVADLLVEFALKYKSNDR